MEHPPGNLTPGGAGVATRPRPQRRTGPDVGLDLTSATSGSARVPAPAHGLQLLGTFERSGHREAPSLVRRADGQTLQLTPLLYAVLEAVDGRRSLDEICRLVAERTGKLIGEQNVSFLIEDRLRPLGVLQAPDGTEPVGRKANPLLALRFRFVVSNPQVTRRIAAPFASLFAAPVAFVLTLSFLAVSGWLLFERGLAPAIRNAIYEPGLLLLVFALTTLSAGFHELGHAAACARGGGRPGAMGVGLYLVFPAFYTDVTDTYRLDRRSRLRVDVGGIYFNAIFGVAAFALWAVSGWEALLAIIPLQALQMLRQMVPLVRLDGYHILADLTGVPDLFAHIKPILVGMLPTHWRRRENRALKPWARFVVTAWVLVVVPLLVFMLAGMVVVLPRLVATAWDSLGQQWGHMTAAWSDGESLRAATHVLALFAIAIPVLSMCYLALRVVRRSWLRMWRGTEGRPVRRGVAIIVAIALLAALATAWWPGDRYRPIEADERGTLADVVDAARSPATYPLLPDGILLSPAVAPQQPSFVQNYVSEGDLGAGAIIDSATSTGDGLTKSVASGSEFRFGLPDPPGDGDNQALAVNYTDGSSVIAMALSLIFANGDAIQNSNEAYAFASCNNCLAAAIAFQLVVILDQADVVVPRNTAAAITAYCLRCVTYALAIQLIVTIDEPLSQEAMRELDAIWGRLEALERNAAKISLAELQRSLAQIQAGLFDLLREQGALDEEASGVAEGGSEEGDGSLDESGTGDAPLSSEPSPSSTADASPSPTPESTPTTEPSPTDEPSPTTEPSPSPS